MSYIDFYNKLKDNRMISPIWEFVLELIELEIKSVADCGEYLKLFAIYFCLVDDGNLAMSLDENKLREKLNSKIDSTEVLLKESAEDPAVIDLNEIRTESDAAVKAVLSSVSASALPQIIGTDKMFEIDNNWLYAKKYNVARKGIINHVNTIFSSSFACTSVFDYKKTVNPGFTLTKGQEKSVLHGASRSLIITGGPGTGKTTSILFILLSILSSDPDYDIYMVAPSGKAASRMKESVIKGLNNITPAFKAANPFIINKIEKLEESTIHRLLSVNSETGGFAYNKDQQFSAKSIFVIDEASMIDACLFNALLQSVNPKSRVFIMGDKNQLPSVDAGAVLADMLKMPTLAPNIIELDESIRFGKDTKIYELAEAVNSGATLPVLKTDWKPYDSFKIEPENKSKPIYYYEDSSDNTKDKDLIEHVVKIWGEEYYRNIQAMSQDLDENDLSALNKLFEYTENGRILSALNDSCRGIRAINKYVKKTFIDKTNPSSVIGFYPGELMMVTKNNKTLDLYNGDSGVLVTFQNDPILYFMVQKDSNIISAPGKHDDKIFKVGNYVFYPLRMITRNEIEPAYAITIHKSQGSDYNNILVILPKNAGHPLLNRQIIYTAITRTKGNTYILSNQQRLEEAKNRLIVRDTNIR